MDRRNEKVWTVFHYLMETGEPQPKRNIVKATGLFSYQVNNVLQKNKDLFVAHSRIPGTHKILWAAWEE